ncbi:hypothetical protein KNP414_06132 [Paenibacillus mucilaginosus KNP414]|uniref:Uncharacterized protein n=1 Tax=Paenibacillus mucilaginosus (strain KNP414) TaxID=1036673 RepID=F8FGJ6_PAEMK|nr:hypothetical protein KNP414_06132 [Paenibacillus mucilaginosus KNP414]
MSGSFNGYTPGQENYRKGCAGQPYAWITSPFWEILKGKGGFQT